MGPTGRGKHKRANRRSRSSKSHDDGNRDAKLCVNHQVGCEKLVFKSCSDHCSEEELEQILLMSMQILYNEAALRLSKLGYEETVVSNAILNNGHCYGEKDVLSNIMDNTLRYLTTGKSDGNRPAFVSMKQLVELSIAAMVYSVQNAMPNLSKEDSMWCLYGSGIHEHPTKFDLTPIVKDLLKKNIEGFAAGFWENSEKLPTQANGCSNASLLNGDSSAGIKSETEAIVEQKEQVQDAKSQEVVSSVSDIFCDLNLDESIEYVPLDEKDEVIIDMLKQVKDLEKQVKERKDWAQQKAMQAERKVCHDQRELIMLRMEREETQRLRGKQTLEDSSKTRICVLKNDLSQMENNLKKATDQLGRTNAHLRQREFQYAEISAELEALELSESESLRTCVEVAKREKKWLKRLLAWEKQKTKLQDDIADAEHQILQLETQLMRAEAAQKDAKAKWREAQKAKESAFSQLEEERCLIETTVATNKREHDALCLKIKTDTQRHKDDLQMLELELARLKVSSEGSVLNHHSTNFPMVNTEGIETHRGLIARMFGELDNEDYYCSDRNCFICVKGEVSVVFLPCAHQVLCSNCCDSYGKKGRPVCPCCGVPIEQRIRVFGAESS